jgi:hypothetical protein
VSPLREADRLRQTRINRRRAARDRRDPYRAKAVAEILGVEWDSLDEDAIKLWHHMAHEMTHLRLDARWNNPLLIAVRMALQVDAETELRKALREGTRKLSPHAHEHLFFISLPQVRQMAWYCAALSAGDIFPSPNDRARPSPADA